MKIEKQENEISEHFVKERTNFEIQTIEEPIKDIVEEEIEKELILKEVKIEPILEDLFYTESFIEIDENLIEQKKEKKNLKEKKLTQTKLIFDEEEHKLKYQNEKRKQLPSSPCPIRSRKKKRKVTIIEID